MTNLQLGRPRTRERRLDREVRVYDFLDELQIEYWRIDHEAAFTMEACEAIDKALEATICKNLFLCNRQKTEFYLLLMPGDKPFKTKDLSAQIGSSRLSFAGEDDMLKYLDVEPGSVSFLGLMNDRDKKVKLLVDEDLLKGEWIGMHPCVNTSSLKIKTADVFGKILEKLGRELKTVKLMGDNNVKIKEAVEKLTELQTKMYAYRTASSALYLDGVTVAPKETSAGRGVALGILAGEEHKLFAAPEVGELISFLKENKVELDEVTARQVELLDRSYAQLSKIPMNEYMEYAQLTNEANDVWHRAKETNDFELFRPVLEKLVKFNIKFAGYYDSSKKPYDALLNEYERGVDMEYLDDFFGKVRSKLVPLIKKIGEKSQIDDSFLYKKYPVEVQRKFSDYIMEVMGLDRNHCTIGETEHPFTLNFSSQDVRITTNYAENSLADSLYSVIHEGGHALYELNVDPAYDYNCLSGGVSMGVHESQSRFYENIIGRSEAFTKAIFPKVKEFFPEQLDGVDEDMFYRAINKAQPSLIRTESDELTYSFHVMIRYEIEKQLIGGTLEVRDIPAEWNRLYKEYLGVDVPDDTRGCLQDSHWSGGSFGYFPSYALGSAYGVQMLRKMENEINVWEAVSKGDISPVTAWLKENVHKYGCLKDPAEIVKNACGGEFDAKYYVEYLEEKFSKLYNL